MHFLGGKLNNVMQYHKQLICKLQVWQMLNNIWKCRVILYVHNVYFVQFILHCCILGATMVLVAFEGLVSWKVLHTAASTADQQLEEWAWNHAMDQVRKKHALPPQWGLITQYNELQSLVMKQSILRDDNPAQPASDISCKMHLRQVPGPCRRRPGGWSSLKYLYMDNGSLPFWNKFHQSKLTILSSWHFEIWLIVYDR